MKIFLTVSIQLYLNECKVSIAVFTAFKKLNLECRHIAKIFQPCLLQVEILIYYV